MILSLQRNKLKRIMFVKNSIKILYSIIFLTILSCGTSEDKWIEEAKSRLNQENYTEAKSAIEQALKLNNESSEAHNLLGVIAYKLEDIELSYQEYKKAVDLDASNINAQLNLANMELEKNNWGEAKKILDFLLLNDQNQSEVYLKRGISFAGLKKVDEAIKDFSKSIEMDSTNFDAHYNRGNIYFQQEKFSLAIEDFENCVQLEDKSGKAFYALGLSYFRNNEIEKSCLALKQARQVGYEDAKAAIDQICL